MPFLSIKFSKGKTLFSFRFYKIVCLRLKLSPYKISDFPSLDYFPKCNWSILWNCQLVMEGFFFFFFFFFFLFFFLFMFLFMFLFLFIIIFIFFSLYSTSSFAFSFDSDNDNFQICRMEDGSNAKYIFQYWLER